MARPLHRLAPRAPQTLSKPGRYADGGGLYLVISPTGSRKWVFRFRWKKKLTDMGLGSASIVSLAKARERAAQARVLIADGVNPLEEKRSRRTVPMFGDFADELVAAVSSQWRNAKHRAQVLNTLKTYAASLRETPVDKIETHDVLGVLKPIWVSKSETASRVRGRIEWVLDAAKARGFRGGENPARWKGHLDQLLPRRQRLARGHHPALPFAQVAGFVGELRGRPAMAALALEFTILTAARSGEVRGARWQEIDFDDALWTVPASRMKAGREHRVPLSSRAIAILRQVEQLSDGKPGSFVFPGPSGPASSLSDAAFSALLKRMGREPGALTPHGFRSSFRDWAGEATAFPRDVAEMSLAHAVGDATERAYRRGDALARRRELMAAWAEHCEPKQR